MCVDMSSTSSPSSSRKRSDANVASVPGGSVERPKPSSLSVPNVSTAARPNSFAAVAAARAPPTKLGTAPSDELDSPARSPHSPSAHRGHALRDDARCWMSNRRESLTMRRHPRAVPHVSRVPAVVPRRTCHASNASAPWSSIGSSRTTAWLYLRCELACSSRRPYLSGRPSYPLKRVCLVARIEVSDTSIDRKAHPASDEGSMMSNMAAVRSCGSFLVRSCADSRTSHSERPAAAGRGPSSATASWAVVTRSLSRAPGVSLTPSPAAAAAAVATTHAFGRILPFIGTESPTSRARHVHTPPLPSASRTSYVGSMPSSWNGLFSSSTRQKTAESEMESAGAGSAEPPARASSAPTSVRNASDTTDPRNFFETLATRASLLVVRPVSACTRAA